jgi:hypothetical protein
VTDYLADNDAHALEIVRRTLVGVVSRPWLELCARAIRSIRPEMYGIVPSSRMLYDARHHRAPRRRLRIR